MKSKLVISLLLFALLLTSGFGCKGESKEVADKMKPITLEYWRVWDGPDDFQEILAKYKQLHPFVTINYRKLRYSEYEQALLEAFATDSGPDIFSIQNTWTRKYQNKGLIAPMPATVTMAYPIVKGTLKKEIVPEIRTKKSVTLTKLKNDFVDVVYDDVVIDVLDTKTNTFKEQVFGLPLYVDTLVMYYNKDLFNNAGITTPPELWNRDFLQDVKKLTKQNTKGQIIQSGVALGGAENIERSSDILSALMMQNGTVMMEDNSVRFHQRPSTVTDKTYNPGLDALRFYSDFANPAKEVYSWNDQMENSITLFTLNKVAMMFGYSYMLPQIKAQAPKLNFSIAKLPQIEGNSQQVNYANYWVEVVSQKILTDHNNLKQGTSYTKQKFDTAWDFVQFATEADQAKYFLDRTKKPTALRELVDGQLDDQDVGIFADQVLTAESWYKGVDAIAAETIIREMIDDTNKGENTIEKLLGLGASKVQQTIRDTK